MTESLDGQPETAAQRYLRERRSGYMGLLTVDGERVDLGPAPAVVAVHDAQGDVSVPLPCKTGCGTLAATGNGPCDAWTTIAATCGTCGETTTGRKYLDCFGTTK